MTVKDEKQSHPVPLVLEHVLNKMLHYLILFILNIMLKFSFHNQFVFSLYYS